MIWFFEREEARLHYEIRRPTDGNDYELVITRPDGRQDVERFDDPRAVMERSLRLQRALMSEGWQPPRVRGQARTPAVEKHKRARAVASR
ncbi:MAG TPA: hypothetical protein VFK20_16735 [Vicinamibacterales bacterium]|nr:hypothetical protein [Vicinamibacterales bacterium]